MTELYQKLYATLSGRVDGVIDYLDLMVSKEQCTKENVEKASDMLKRAMLEAEETYLASGEQQ